MSSNSHTHALFTRPGGSKPTGDSGSSATATLSPPLSSSNVPAANGPGTVSTVHHSEDRLGRAWRGIASTVVVAAGKAEKAVATTPQSPDAKTSLKELDDAVLALLRSRVEYSRLISYLEAKLQGREEEVATLQHYHRSQPRLGASRHYGTNSKPSGSQ
jgi:hypothetical protein